MCLSSPLLLRIPPNTFVFIPILPMFLSSPNCRIHAVIRHIAPYYVQSCRIMFYSKFEILWPYVEAGIFAPASTYGQLFFTRPYKNRSPFPITSPRYAPYYRTSSPLITVLKALPWQMKSTLIVVLFLLVLPRNAIPRLSSRSRQSQNARLCKHIGTLRSLLRVFCKECYWFTYKSSPSS